MNTTKYLLTCLTEEASEIIKESCKAGRFGLDDVSPLEPSGPNNQARIVAELNDLLGVVRMLELHGLIPSDWRDEQAQARKVEKVKYFMGYSEDRGHYLPGSGSPDANLGPSEKK